MGLLLREGARRRSLSRVLPDQLARLGLQTVRRRVGLCGVGELQVHLLLLLLVRWWFYEGAERVGQLLLLLLLPVGV